MEKLSSEVAYIAYHFHWGMDDILEMEHKERHMWIKEVSEIMATPEARTRCEDLSLEPVSIGPDGMRAVMNADLAKYRELNKRLKISME